MRSKGNENSGNGAEDSPRHPSCLLFLFTVHFAATAQLLYIYPAVQNTKDLGLPESNKLEALSLIRFV